MKVFLQDPKYEEMLAKVCKNEQNAFHKACKGGSVEVMAILVSEGRDKIDFNAKDNRGMTAFMLACMRGHQQVVRELLAKVDDLDPNAKDNDGNTGFMWACQWGRLEVVRELLNTAQCDKEAKDNKGRSGYDWAMKEGKSEVAELIRQHRANVLKELLAELDDLEPNAKSKSG